MSQAFNADREYRLSCQKFLETLIDRRDYRAAARYYDSVSESVCGRTDILSGIFLRLGAKAFGSNSDFDRALTLIRTAINMVSKEAVETEELGTCYLILGDILRDMGNLSEAEKAFRDAESIFRRNDNYYNAGDALNRLAGILFRKGDFEASLRAIIEAIEYAREEKNEKKLAFLYGNIGRIYTLLGKLKEAKKNIIFNIDLSSGLNDEIEMARACLSLGYVNIQMAEFDEAEEALADAIELIKNNKMEREEIIYLTYSGELLLATKQYEGAEWMLKEAHTRGSKLAPVSLLATRPLRLLAELYKDQKKYRQALQISNKALAVMKELDSVETGALYKIQAVCKNSLNDGEESLKLFGRALSTLDECRAKIELGDALAEAGLSNLYNPQQSLMYLCRAEEIFNSCGNRQRALAIERQIGAVTVEGESAITNNIVDEAIVNEFPTRNKKMTEIAAQLKLLRQSDLPILLTGETGTGKDFMARHFHSISRPDQPYVAINCAAVPETLIESELFGYQKGAFTGADANRQGLFMAANGGVLLLDEIGELPLHLQAKLLSVLESRKFRPLGSSNEVELDIILLTATNRNLAEMVELGQFRRDLYYRLAGITFDLPPLRERKEDIPMLLETFMNRFGLQTRQTLDSELVTMFVGHDWPGNIRQLENKVKQLSVLATMAKDGSIIELSRPFFEQQTDTKNGSLFEQVENFEKQLLVEALISASGNKSEAARILSIHESTFRAKMKKYNLEYAAG